MSQYSDEQLMQMVQSAASNAAPPPGATQPQSPQDRATAAGEQQGRDSSAGFAAADQFSRQMTFGGSNYINAGVRYAGQRLMGVKNPDSFQTDLALSRGMSTGEMEAHPIAGTIGGLAGGTVGAGKLLKPVVAAVPALRALATAKGVAPHLARAGLNATIGTGSALAEGDNLPHAATTGVISAGVGEAGSQVITRGAKVFRSASQQAFDELAKHLDMKPDDLQAAMDARQRITGAPTSMAQITNLYQQGKLRLLAAAQPHIAKAAIVAENAADQPFHEQLAQASAASKPQTISGMKDARTAQMDKAMNAPHPVTGVSVADSPVPVTPQIKKVFDDSAVTFALKGDSRMLGTPSMFGGDSVLNNVNSNDLTVRDIETTRRALREAQDGYAADPSTRGIAKKFGEAATAVENIGRNAHAGYGAALDGYKAAARYAHGFQHGLDGNLITDAGKGNDNLLSAALSSPDGKAGYAHGQALAQGQAALEAISPSHVNPSADYPNVNHAAQAAMAAVSPSPVFKIMHSMKAMANIKLPVKVQQKIASNLFSQDPAVFKSAMSNLRRAGARDDQIHALASAAGGSAALHASNFLTPQNQGEGL